MALDKSSLIIVKLLPLLDSFHLIKVKFIPSRDRTLASSNLIVNGITAVNTSYKAIMCDNIGTIKITNCNFYNSYILPTFDSGMYVLYYINSFSCSCTEYTQYVRFKL